jgi:transposase-like protein
VFFDDLLKKPHFEFQKILSFISKVRLDQNQINDFLSQTNELFQKIRQDLNSLASSKQLIIPFAILKLGNRIIQNEMKISNGLQKWPCKSFKELETVTSGYMISSPSAVIKLPIIRFYELSTNCSDSMNLCSVQYDMNEQIKE